MRFRFALLQITWDRPDPEPDEPPDIDPRSTTALNTERSEPRRIRFGGDDLPNHEGKR